MTKNNLYSHLKKSLLQVCTISTASHLFKSFALANSIAPYGLHLHILVVDDFAEVKVPSNVTLVLLKHKLNTENYKQVYTKYHRKMDKLRWALKPVFMIDLLDDYEHLVYLDNDCFLFGSPIFMDELLKQHNLLLTPHFYDANPQKNQNWLEANYRVGLFNAGFIAANNKAKAALYWWMQCCLYSLKKATWRGLFDDQKYLDLLPIQFDGVHILKHRGCNVAGWNDDALSVIKTENNWVINQNTELVFVHFAPLTMNKWSNPSHKFNLLYQTYLSALQKHKPNFIPNVTPNRYQLSAYCYYLRWKMVRFFEQ